MAYTEFTVQMTGDSSPSPNSCSASSVEGGGAEAYRAFDRSDGNSWVSASGCPQWVEFNTGGETYLLTKYALRNRQNSARYPVSWEIQGYNGSTWDTLDSRSGITWSGDWVTQEYEIASPGTTKYSRFRWYVTAVANGGGEQAQINEIYFYTSPPELVVADTTVQPSSENITLVLVYDLVVVDSSVAITVENIILQLAALLSVDDTNVLITSENIGIEVINSLGVIGLISTKLPRTTVVIRRC